MVLCKVGMRFLIIKNLIEGNFTIPKILSQLLILLIARKFSLIFNPEFLNLCNIDILDWVILCCGDLSGALQDVYQDLCLLFPRCQ